MSSPVTMTRAVAPRGLRLTVFDRALKALHRGRVASSACDLHRGCAAQMLDRRAFIKRETPIVLEVGAHTGWLFRHMLEQRQLFGLKQYIQTDSSEERLNRNYDEVKHLIPDDVEYVQICCDEEQSSPFGVPAHTVDMVASCLSLHWVNDLETAMRNIRHVLKRDGLFMCCMFGGNTLYELRGSLTLAQNEVLGGVAPHVSPMLDGAGMSSLILQAGFAIPTIDLDRHLLLYKSPFQLMEHLDAMGESACHLMRTPLRRDVLLSACAVYDTLYRKNELVPATFEVFHTVAWSPSPTQVQPLARGSAQLSLAAWNAANRAKLQRVLDEFAQNPDDAALQAKAEAVIRSMQEESDATSERQMQQAAEATGGDAAAAAADDDDDKVCREAAARAAGLSAPSSPTSTSPS